MTATIVIGIAALSGITVLLTLLLQEREARKEEVGNLQKRLKESDAFWEDLYWRTDKTLCDTHMMLLAKMEEAAELQDFKSSVLCPTNGHIWQDGICRKCGRHK